MTKPGAVRLYRQVSVSYLMLSDLLETELRDATPGDLVPSEHQLARRHGVSRLTARAALQEMERRNLVRRIQGRGTFVARRIDYRITPDLPASFTEIVRQSGVEPTTTNDRVFSRAASAAERIALELPRGARVVEVRRRRWIDGELVGTAASVLPADLVPGLAGRLGKKGSVYNTLVKEYDLQPVRTWSRVEIEVATTEVAERLELRGRPHVIRFQGRLESDRTGRPIEMGDSWLRADIFNVVMEIGRFK